VIDGDTWLAEIVDTAIVPDAPDQLRPVRNCRRCETGSLHVVGIQKLANGRRTAGAFVVCDQCGSYGGRR
jgi:hypothetical protein